MSNFSHGFVRVGSVANNPGHSQRLKIIMAGVALASILCASTSKAGEATSSIVVSQQRTPGSSFPPDATQYNRPAVPGDWTIAPRQRTPGSSFPPDTTRYGRPAVLEDLIKPRQPQALQLPSGVTISGPIDVTNNADFTGYAEPAIAVSVQNPNLIVIHGGFDDWSDGSTNGSLFVSTDGGATWNRRQAINPPPLGFDHGPADATIYYFGSELFGAFLGGGAGGAHIYTGATNDLSTPSFQWRSQGSPPVAQKTEQISTLNNDQPWLVVNRRPPIVEGAQPKVIPPIQIPEPFVAYNDFSTNPVGLRVAVSPGGVPPTFTVDNQDGSTANGPSLFINPGHRLAVAGRTVIPTPGGGDVVTGLVYSLYQTCTDCTGGSTDLPTVKYMLNRTRDGGVTWSLNGSSSGIEIDEAPSRQGEGGASKKFGAVNALLGGIDAIAVDPTDGQVFVVYGHTLAGFNLLSARRLSYDQSGVLVSGPAIRVTAYGVQAALPSVAVAANGVVGVLYDTFDGNDPATGLPAFSAHLAVADGRAALPVFTDVTLKNFLSPALNNFDPGQRVWGDYQQMVAVRNKFYGVFSGNGAAFGKSQASTDPIFFTADVSDVARLTVSKNLEHPDHNHLRLFNLQIDGVTVGANINGGSAGTVLVSPGGHTVGETGGAQTSLGAFTKVIGGDCAANGSVNLAQGDSKTCRIINYDLYGGCQDKYQCCDPGQGTQGCQRCLPVTQSCP